MLKWNIFNNSNGLGVKFSIQSFLYVINVIAPSILLFSIILKKNPITIIDGNPLIAIAALPTIYWYLNTIFYRKWKHCADLVEKYIDLDLKEPTGSIHNGVNPSEGNVTARSRYNKTVANYQHALVMDLLHLDLWAHKSYYRYFNNILIEKLNQKKGFTGMSYTNSIQKLLKGKITTKQVNDFIREIEE